MTEENIKTTKNYSSENDDYESQISNLLEQINKHVEKGEYEMAEKKRKK